VGKITMIVVNKQQYLKELAHLTLLNCLNANGIIRFKYNQKLKQKRKGINMTEEQARQEFDNLRNDDEHFDNQWGCNDYEQQEKSFYEWCSLYDDLKHITQKEVA
jgi:hypothetical protein